MVEKKNWVYFPFKGAIFTTRSQSAGARVISFHLYHWHNLPALLGGVYQVKDDDNVGDVIILHQPE